MEPRTTCTHHAFTKEEIAGGVQSKSCSKIVEFDGCREASIWTRECVDDLQETVAVFLKDDEVGKILASEEGTCGLSMTFPSLSIRIEDASSCV